MEDRYTQFIQNPFIRTIAGTEKWTVSTKDKMPIDIKDLAYRNRLHGATFNNEISLGTLDFLHQTIPEAANYAFYLDALEDNFVVLDIEPKCPDDIRQSLTDMPCLYCETSMSGRGVHMVFRLPEDILNQHPDARQKVVFKENHGYYEILLNHYVTFTANQIPAVIGEDDTEFRKLFEQMASHQKLTVKADINAELLETVDAPHADLILNILRNYKGMYKKTLADFNDDNSKYEFAYIAYLNYRLGLLTDIPSLKQQHEYTDSEKAWFLYTVATEYLPSRPKHEEQRNGMPWLYYLAFEVIAHNKNDEKKPKQKKKGGKK